MEGMTCWLTVETVTIMGVYLNEEAMLKIMAGKSFSKLRRRYHVDVR